LGPTTGLVFVIINGGIRRIFDGRIFVTAAAVTPTIILAIFLAHAPLHIISDRAQSIKLCLIFGGTIFAAR
jgi:hypothetical protein